MTTRSKQAMEEKLTTIVAMLEEQQQRQEQVLQQSCDLARQQKACEDRLAEMDRLREYVRGLSEAIEGRLQAAERALAERTGTETDRQRETDPATSIAKKEDSGSSELRPTAPEFQPSGAERNATVGVEAGA